MLSIVVPCFNEQESLPYFVREVEKITSSITHSIEYIFVNDGSKDDTLQSLRKLHRKMPDRVRYISFSKNFGKESALYAGLQAAQGDLITVMDADLQDPPELLPQMIERIETSDIDCVGTRREDRKGEPPVRSFFARLFYKLVNKFGDTEMIDGARDFRLMTRQMVDAILSMTEYNRFSKGIFSWVGFNTEYISYENRERVAGKTSWSFWSLFKYSIDGIVNFSDAPLTLAAFTGGLSCIAAIIALIFIVIRALLFGDPTSGWPSLASIVLFMGGLQLLSLGIIGKYIGKIFLETKKRPIYIVKETEKDIEKER
ncbi:glycosyltransferase family 2 protein [Tetragenococcus koreensis]|uniref:glycosyltransferase family 2 protein n=1 Tax=Tetragenococcus koreensis TaxID=290335 RepID=UPI001F1A4029|nr:glycosyltransferase family 2 protein [Tetragenococcus koreensis]MCF1623158.1 glycosyltransferase family 2 protein [Tetragenococcus koreensis]MCF1628146.1 glycosyltransferase family 2 protein [Tetragenococcus koreensis]MCF1633057.1 glycosyltransferase family 2 protein [Tetragenococcus koreensis]MCF1679196.1 glycosyltransferase family 2 protein [Tetragenococcus koreensis]MCF1681575.1 glycosyltransferase family 2 protein [Tetragenococcus koreensis]